MVVLVHRDHPNGLLGALMGKTQAVFNVKMATMLALESVAHKDDLYCGYLSWENGLVAGGTLGSKNPGMEKGHLATLSGFSS